MVGNPHPAQNVEFELSELILLLKLDKQFTVEQVEATLSQSTVPSPPLNEGKVKRTLTRELKAPEIGEREANGTSASWQDLCVLM